MFNLWLDSPCITVLLHRENFFPFLVVPEPRALFEVALSWRQTTQSKGDECSSPCPTPCCPRGKLLWRVFFLHIDKMGLRRDLYLLISAKRKEEGVWEVEVLERSSFMKRLWWFCKKELANTDYQSIQAKENCEHKLRKNRLGILGFFKILRILVNKIWKCISVMMV